MVQPGDGARQLLVRALREMAGADIERIRRLVELEKTIEAAWEEFEKQYTTYRHACGAECKEAKAAVKMVLETIRRKRIEIEEYTKKRVLNELLNSVVRG